MTVNTVPVRSLVSALALTIGSSALAQEPAGRSMALEEIIVTAQKREENLQRVPIAVTALGSETISAFRVTNIEGLSNLAPNLNVQQ